MPQTMLAILALMVAMLFAHSQQRNMIHTHQELIKNEFALQGTSVAEEMLDEVGSMTYYDRVFEDDNTSQLNDPSDLTPERDFSVRQARAIEDFHGMSERRWRVFGEDTLYFNVEIEVRYANETDMSSEVGMQTKVKRAIATVWSLDLPNPDTVNVSRAYICGSPCAWD